MTARDRPGLFALLAGTLTVHGIDILGVDLFVRDDGVVLDTLRVAEVPGQRPRAARAPRARRGGADRRRRRAARRRRAPSTRGRRRRGSARGVPAAGAARAPGGPLRPGGLGARDRGRGEGPGPARSRLHHRPHARRAGARHHVRAHRHGEGAGARRVLRARRARDESSDPESLPGVERALLDALGARDENRSDR